MLAGTFVPRLTVLINGPATVTLVDAAHRAAQERLHRGLREELGEPEGMVRVCAPPSPYAPGLSTCHGTLAIAGNLCVRQPD